MTDQTETIRETCTEYNSDGRRFLVIQDPHNHDAWIESSLALPIEQ